MGKRELIAQLSLSSLCIVMVVWLFLAVPWVYLRFVIVVFLDHTHLLFLNLSSIYTPSAITVHNMISLNQNETGVRILSRKTDFLSSHIFAV